MNKLNRQFKYSNENQRVQTDRTNKIEAGVFQVLKEIKEMKDHLVQYNYSLRMDLVDMSQYFPITCDGDIDRFMKKDEEWNQRKKARFFFSFITIF